MELGILETLLWVLCLPLLVLQAWVTLQVAVPVAALAHLSNLLPTFERATTYLRMYAAVCSDTIAMSRFR